MAFYNILRYIVFNSKLWQHLVNSAQTSFFKFTFNNEIRPPTPYPNHPLAEFCVRFLVTIPWAGSLSLIEF